MAQVEIYTTPICPYCLRAKRLLAEKRVAFTEIDVSRDPAKRDEMVARAGGRYTVPQVFIDGTPIGGSDDLYALEDAGQLDPMLMRA
jgi:glutaredoxin 3